MHPSVQETLDRAFRDMGRRTYSEAGVDAFDMDSFGLIQLLLLLERSGLPVQNELVEQLSDARELARYMDSLGPV